MHQRLKLDKGEIDGIRYWHLIRREESAYSPALMPCSSYCPLDLFSGEPERIRRALMDMLHVPQNNIKIYIGGELAYTGSLVRGVISWCVA